MGRSGLKYYPCVLLLMCILSISFAYSDWLIKEKSYIQSSAWATVTKFGMLIVVGTGINHEVCRQQIFIFNASFAYLFCLANNKKDKYPEFDMGYSEETW